MSNTDLQDRDRRLRRLRRETAMLTGSFIKVAVHKKKALDYIYTPLITHVGIYSKSVEKI